MKRWIGPILVAVLALTYPLLDQAGHWGTASSVIEVLLYVILALGLNVVVGFGGLLHLGYAAFFSIGAFTMAHLTSVQSSLPDVLLGGHPAGFWFGLVVSCLVATLFGAILGAPTLRLRGDYLAIVTMGFGLILQPLLVHFDQYTKAETSLAGVAPPNFFGHVVTSTGTFAWYYIGLTAVVFTIFIVSRLRDSRMGRALKAMREDELAASGCGINLVGIKLLAFLVGAFFAGLAGALYASRLGTLRFGFPQEFQGSIMFLAMIILGGVGSVRGAVLGALVIGLVNKVITPMLADHFPLLDKAQFLMFGLILVLMMLLRPEGILPEETMQAQLKAAKVEEENTAAPQGAA